MTAKFWIAIGAVSGFVSVAMGAFGAHALAERLDEKMLTAFRTGAQYQMYHALALVAFGMWASTQGRQENAAAACFAAGTVLFSGSLYAMALTGVRGFGAVTPIGGLLFMAGWIAWAFRAWRS